MLQPTTFALPAGTFHALVGGAADARPLVYLHGFPDHPPTAVRFLEHFVGTHRVVAPWLRGYAPSPRVQPYDRDTLVGDVLALIDQVAPDGGPVDLVGHDWGAVLTYGVCQVAPDRVRRAVAMTVPHPRTFRRQLRKPQQALRSSYAAVFQLPGAGWLVRALLPKLRPDLDPVQRALLVDCLRESLPAPLEYYRQVLRPFRTLSERQRRAEEPIHTPMLQLYGADDPFVLAPRTTTPEDADCFGERIIEILPGRGHFLLTEAADEIATRVQAWLA